VEKFFGDESGYEWFIGAIVSLVVFVINEIVAPTYDKLSGKYAECNDICRAFPPIMNGEGKRDCGDNQRWSKV